MQKLLLFKRAPDVIFKKLCKDTILYGGSDFFIKLIAFFTFPLIASVLAPRDFGVLELVTTLVGFLGLFVNLGLNNAVQRFYWDTDSFPGEKKALVSTGLYLQFSLWLLLAVCLLFALPKLKEILNFQQYGLGAFGIFAAILLVFVTQATQYILDVVRLHFSPLRFFTFSFAGRALTAVGALIVVVFLSGGIEGFLLAQALIGLLVLPLGLWLVRRDLGLVFSKSVAKKAASYGYPFIFAGLAYWLFSSMDRWMLSVMSSLEETGHYSVAFRFASLVMFVSTAFGQAWSPYAIKIKTDYPERYRKLYADIFIILVFVMLIVGGGLALFAGEVIGLLMSSAYEASALPLSILCFAIIFQSTQQMTAIGISLEKKTRLLALISWAAAFVNLAGNYIFIQTWGASGAALATLLSYLFISTAYLYFSQKLHPIPVAWSRLAFLAIAGASILLVSLKFSSSDWHWPMILIKLGFALMWLFIGLRFIPVKKILQNAPT